MTDPWTAIGQAMQLAINVLVMVALLAIAVSTWGHDSSDDNRSHQPQSPKIRRIDERR